MNFFFPFVFASIRGVKYQLQMDPGFTIVLGYWEKKCFDKAELGSENETSKTHDGGFLKAENTYFLSL